MVEVTLEFIAKRLDAIQADQSAMRADQAAIRASLADLAADQTVLTEMVLRVERKLVQVRDHLGRIDGRLAHLESAS